MSRIRLSLLIQAPKDLVFSILTDLESFAKLQPSITELSVSTTGPARVGTAWTVKRKLGERESIANLAITSMSAPDSLVIEGASSGVYYKTCYELSQQESGTLIEMDFEGSSEGFVASLMDKMTAGTLKECLQDDLDKVKLEAESKVKATQESSVLKDHPEPLVQSSL